MRQVGVQEELTELRVDGLDVRTRLIKEVDHLVQFVKSRKVTIKVYDREGQYL